MIKYDENGKLEGCSQLTYCGECLAFPMGLGCPNIVKGPVQVNDIYGDKTWGKE